MKLKKTGAVFFAVSMLASPAAGASAWAEKPGSYAKQTGRKFLFGIQHSLFSIVMPWLEAHDEKYEKQWTGFCVGIGKTVVYTGAGLIQLVSFPVPVDFPDIEGIRIPGKKEKRPKGMTKLAVLPPVVEGEESYEGAFGEGKDAAAPVKEPSEAVEPAATAAPVPEDLPAGVSKPPVPAPVEDPDQDPAAAPEEEVPSLDEIWQTPKGKAPGTAETQDTAMEEALEEAAGEPYSK